MPQLSLLAHLVAALALSAPVVAPETVADDPPAVREAAVAAIVSESDAPRALEALRSTAFLTLFEVLGAGGVPAAWSDTGAFQPLPEERLGQLFEVLATLPGVELRAHLARIAVEEARLEHRTAGVRLCGRIALGTDLPLLLELGAPRTVEGQESPTVLPRAHRKVVQEALEHTLTRDIGAFLGLPSVFSTTHVGLRAAIVDAIASIEGVLAIETLALLIGRDRDLDPYLLNAITRRARTRDFAVTEDLRERVRYPLRSERPETVRTAIAALAALGDDASVPDLLNLLEQRETSVGAAAHRALQELSGLALGFDPPLWFSWYEQESTWLRDTRPGLALALTQGDTPQALQAVRSYVRRRLFRDDLAGDLVKALDRREPAVVELVCSALGRLASPVALPRLTTLLEHQAARVRRAAWEALRAITGRDLPPDPALWRAAV